MWKFNNLTNRKEKCLGGISQNYFSGNQWGKRSAYCFEILWFCWSSHISGSNKIDGQCQCQICDSATVSFIHITPQKKVVFKPIILLELNILHSDSLQLLLEYEILQNILILALVSNSTKLTFFCWHCMSFLFHQPQSKG